MIVRYYFTFKSLMACSHTSSSFLFHSTELITLVQMMLIMACSERLAFFISSLVKAMICTGCKFVKVTKHLNPREGWRPI